MFGASRSGGVRGGQDQFNWDDVKGDKHRENYLGKWSKMGHPSSTTVRCYSSCLVHYIRLANY